MAFELDTFASINHLNVRKQGPDDDKRLACDIKLRGEIGIAPILKILGCEQAEAEYLWRDNKDQDVRFFGISEIDTWASFDKLKVKIGRLPFEGANAHKFKIKPIAGMKAEATFSVTLTDISEDDIGSLAEFLQDQVNVHILGEEDMFDKK